MPNKKDKNEWNNNYISDNQLYISLVRAQVGPPFKSSHTNMYGFFYAVN